MDEADGWTDIPFARTIKLTFRADSGLTTIAGGTVSTGARNVVTGDWVDGVADIAAADLIDVTFADDDDRCSLAAGTWQIQTVAAPAGGVSDKVVMTAIIRAGKPPAE